MSVIIWHRPFCYAMRMNIVSCSRKNIFDGAGSSADFCFEWAEVECKHIDYIFFNDGKYNIV